jgi:hypothetical protein
MYFREKHSVRAILPTSCCLTTLRRSSIIPMSDPLPSRMPGSLTRTSRRSAKRFPRRTAPHTIPPHFFIGRSRDPPYAWSYADDDMRPSNLLWLMEDVIDAIVLENLYLDELGNGRDGMRMLKRQRLDDEIIDLTLDDDVSEVDTQVLTPSPTSTPCRRGHRFPFTPRTSLKHNSKETRTHMPSPTKSTSTPTSSRSTTSALSAFPTPYTPLAHPHFAPGVHPCDGPSLQKTISAPTPTSLRSATFRALPTVPLPSRSTNQCEAGPSKKCGRKRVDEDSSSTQKGRFELRAVFVRYCEEIILV